MKMMPLPLFAKRFLGVDIGSLAIRVVELSCLAKKIKLENFGEIPAKAIFREPFRTFEKSLLHLSTDDIVRGIKAVLEEARIKTKDAFFSIPDFVTFFTAFELPPMSKKEIPLAVQVEARRHIPVPLPEVVYDWRVLSPFEERKEKIKILLVAVPKGVVNQYQIIAQKAGLKLLFLEAEVFSLVRVFGEENKTIAILDVGAKTTSCSIIENKILKKSFSLDLGGELFSEKIAKNLGIGFEEGEKIKKEFGIEDAKIRDILLPLINSILAEVGKIFQEYEKEEKKRIEKVILAGGGANLLGLKEYSKIQLGKEVEVGNPFKQISYPPILEPALREIGPSLSIAVGLALKGFEK